MEKDRMNHKMSNGNGLKNRKGEGGASYCIGRVHIWRKKLIFGEQCEEKHEIQQKWTVIGKEEHFSTAGAP